MDRVTQIEALLAPSLAEMGYEIVRVLFSGNKRKTLQIMIDRLDGTGILLDDCEKVSKKSAFLFDEQNTIEEAYVLEVSSPGLNRPLVKTKDFERFVGEKVSIKTHCLIEKRKKFYGTLESATKTGIRIKLEREETTEAPLIVDIVYADIQSARLEPGL